jgi:hypothetical protein
MTRWPVPALISSELITQSTNRCRSMIDEPTRFHHEL